MKSFWKNNIVLIVLLAFISFAQADSLFYSFHKIKKNDRLVFIPVRFDSCSIGLALSGGGARGAAHLGILKKMKEYGLPVSRISGASIGAVVGALIIAGYNPDQILSILENYEWDKLYNNKADRTNIIVPLKKQSDNYFLNLLLSEKGPFIPISLSYGQKLLNRLAGYVYGLTFDYHHDYEKMAIPFRIIATDLLTGKKVVMRRGPLSLNLLASMSYPLLFAPVELKHKMLIDGGIAENIPVDELIGKVNLIFASDVTAGLRGREFLNAPWQIADQVTTIMMKYNKEKLENADFVFQPPVKEYSSTDFHMLEQFVNFGERNFDMALPNIRKILENRLKHPVIFEKLYIHNLSFYSPTSNFSVNIDTILSLNMLTKHLSLFYGKAPDSLIYSMKNQSLKIFYSKGSIYENLRIFKDGKLEDVVKPVSLAMINLIFPPAFRDPVQFGKFLFLKNGYLVEFEKKASHKNTLDIYYRSVQISKKDVKIDLTSKTRPYVLKREIIYPDSMTSHRDALLSSIQNLYGLDLFRRVLVYYTRDTSNINQPKIHIYTEEKPLTNLKIGISANKNLKGEVGFALVNNNLAGHNLSFITNGVIGTRRRYISFRFNTNRIGYTNTGLFAGYRALWESRDLYFNHKNSGKFSYTRDEISIGLAKFLEKLGYTTVSVYFRNEYGPSDITLLNNARYKSAGFRLESIVDKRDFIPIATRGIYSHLAMESSTMFQGNSEIRYNKFEIELRWFKKIWKYSIINPFFSGGIMENQVPFLTWFSTGGPKRKLGWNIYENYGKVYGIWGINFYQKVFPFVWGEKYLKLSMDWGNFWHDSETGFNWDELKPGMGIAFIISTIVGPIEISYEINEKHDKFFWFSLGYNF